MSSKAKKLEGFTNYIFWSLGDTFPAPIRPCQIVGYDKYSCVEIIVDDYHYVIQTGYIYNSFYIRMHSQSDPPIFSRAVLLTLPIIDWERTYCPICGVKHKHHDKPWFPSCNL